MFSKNDRTGAPPVGAQMEPQPRSAKQRTGVPSIVSSDLKIVGSLNSDGEVQIDGTVEGNITGQVVTVSKDAVIEGSITAHTVHISGTINGQIEASSVMLAKPARVKGDIVHQTLAIEAGAHVEGFCRPRESNLASIETPPAPKPAFQGPKAGTVTDLPKKVSGAEAQ